MDTDHSGPFPISLYLFLAVGRLDPCSHLQIEGIRCDSTGQSYREGRARPGSTPEKSISGALVTLPHASLNRETRINLDRSPQRALLTCPCSASAARRDDATTLPVPSVSIGSQYTGSRTSSHPRTA